MRLLEEVRLEGGEVEDDGLGHVGADEGFFSGGAKRGDFLFEV